MFDEQQLKQKINEEIGQKAVFTVKDKKGIFQALSEPRSGPLPHKTQILSTLTLIGFAFAIMFFVFQEMNLEPRPAEEGNVIVEEKVEPIDILEKVDQLQETFRIGMTIDEITNMMGTDSYEIVKNTDSEDGTIHDLKFNLYTAPGFKSYSGAEIEEQSLLNGQMGIQLFIGMNPDATAARLSMFYVKGDELMISYISEESQFVEPMHMPVVVDQAEVIPITLSAQEQALYDILQEDLNIQHLIGIDPMTVAKLYVQASYDQVREVEYELYTDRKEYVLWSKEEHMQIPTTNLGTGSTFNHLDKGTFIQTDAISGYIEYENNGSKSGFQMIMNEDGIWQVSFMPIQ